MSTTHADRITAQLRAAHGDTIATTWHPLVEASLQTWYTGGDVHAPLAIDGKQIEIGGHTATALAVLDLMADTLGVEAITHGADFTNLEIAL